MRTSSSSSVWVWASVLCCISKNDAEIEDRTKTYEMQHKTLAQTQTELDELVRMRYRGLITDDAFFLKEKADLESKIAALKAQLRETENRAEHWLELTEKTFNFALYARKAFLLAKTIEVKREILRTLAENSLLKDQELNVTAYEWFVPIKNGYPALEAKYLSLEPEKMPMNTAQIETLATIRTEWRGRPDLNR